MGRVGIKDSRIKKELESTGVKQLAEKLAMVADLLKYSPHSEITDVHSGICVSICNLLLSMSFSSYLPPTHSGLMPGHPLPESPFFPKREPAPPHLTMVIFHLIPEEKDLHPSIPLFSVLCYPCPCSLSLSHAGLSALLYAQHTGLHLKALHQLYSAGMVFLLNST